MQSTPDWHCISGSIKQGLSNLDIGDKCTLRYDSAYAPNDHITERSVEFLGVEQQKAVLKGSDKRYQLSKKGQLLDYDKETHLALDARIHKGDGYWIGDICIRPPDVAGVRQEILNALSRQEVDNVWIGGTRLTYREWPICNHCNRQNVEEGVRLQMCTKEFLCDNCAYNETDYMDEYIEDNTAALLGETLTDE